MEVGLNVVAKSLGVEPNIPSWDGILKKITKEVETRSEDVVWKTQNQEFYTGVTANLYAIKTAWRNPTMHVAGVYDEERARDVFNAVKGFMRHIAARLSE